MKDVAEVGIIWASRTGSYNHNEIVVPVGLDTEADESIELGFDPTDTTFAVGGDSWSNHNEMVIVG
ncbi:hypothetical protein ABT150_50315 [Streptomyces mirabilis]|uniref:hypothetical protein n=1 Tax=Streptomyces mirabilis TaxID=68239 RepID=UPI003324CB14